MFTTFRSVLHLTGAISSFYNTPRVFSLSITTTTSCCKLFRSPVKFTKQKKIQTNEENETDIEVRDDNLDVLIERWHLRPGSGHQILVIQPVIKWGPQKKRNTTPELQLLESVTLIKTLRQWKVVDKLIISLQSFHKKTVFGKGNVDMLKNKIQNNAKISAVFISINTLTLRQQMELEAILEVPVFDRYTIVMHIFREHAKTREAKLQVQLAELPYLWSVIGGMNEGIGSKFGGGGNLIGGDVPRLLEYRKEVFRVRQAKLKREIMELREQRQLLRKKREVNEIPVIAVVGYTNAGKTSLIKVLTGKESLEPQDYLFATLDVTCHIGELPSGLKVYYVDTLGFISDIPTYLIESFVSTLEDAIQADVIIHVRDISHPDAVAQNDNVMETLKGLNLSEQAMENIITVGNKSDLVNTETLQNYPHDIVLVSCTKLTGVDVLRQEVEKKILALTDKQEIVIRVPSGGEEYEWLHENTTIVEEKADVKNEQFMLVKVIMSTTALSIFKYHFIKNYKKR